MYVCIILCIINYLKALMNNYEIIIVSHCSNIYYINIINPSEIKQLIYL